MIGEDQRRILLRLAREALVAHLRGEPLPSGASTDSELAERRACFITLRGKDSRELRGCRGETRPVRPLRESICRMTASAASDPRFPAVTQDELDALTIEISALTPFVRIQPDQVEIGRHGLMIERGAQVGLLLPQVSVAQGWDRLAFLRGVCQKAGLEADAWQAPEAQLWGFEAEIWGEE